MNNIFKSSILSYDKVCLIEKLNNSFPYIYYGGSIALTAYGIINRQIHDIDIIVYESNFEHICDKLKPYKKKKQNNKKELVTSPEKKTFMDDIFDILNLKKTQFENSLKQNYFLKFTQSIDINLSEPNNIEDNFYSTKFNINNIDICIFKSMIPIEYKKFEFYDIEIQIQTPEKIIEAKQFYVNKQGTYSDIMKKHQEDIDNYLIWKELHC